MSYLDKRDKGARFDRNTHVCPKCGSGDTGTRVAGERGQYPTQYECSACGAVFDVPEPRKA